jgi:hypothetical protein
MIVCGFMKARRDLAMLYDRPIQVLNDNDKPPHVLFCLTSKDKIEVMRWMKKIMIMLWA